MSAELVINISYNQFIRTIREAHLVSHDPNATKEKVEECMRALFFDERTTQESIRLYNRLERTWKLMTGWVDEEQHLI
jgi:hypothetical protein